MFLLDTNVVSELRRPRPHGAVIAWIKSVPGTALFLPAIVIGEMQAGVERTRLQDPAKAEAIDRWIDRIASSYGVIAFDHDMARLWARLLHGRSSALAEDAMIAATALRRGLTVATRNIRDFRPFGVPTINPFDHGRDR